MPPALRGPLLRPGDGGYDEARKVWNGMIDRRPALIARCTGVADVMAAVRFARDHTAARRRCSGGGHNITGNAVCEGGLMIDLSPMKSVRVDPVKRIARAEAGLTWGEYNRETQAFGLASTGGVVSTTGIAGLTLGGGLGWLMGKHGLSCDNLLSADLVTAEGKFLTVSADQHPDLFWGLRGGGGNFGVVTSFEYRLHPVGPVLAGMVLHPMAKAKEVLRFYRDLCAQLPRRGARRCRADDVARRCAGRRHYRRLYRGSRGRGGSSGARPEVRFAVAGHDRPDLIRRS